MSERCLWHVSGVSEGCFGVFEDVGQCLLVSVVIWCCPLVTGGVSECM